MSRPPLLSSSQQQVSQFAHQQKHQISQPPQSASPQRHPSQSHQRPQQQQMRREEVNRRRDEPALEGRVKSTGRVHFSDATRPISARRATASANLTGICEAVELPPTGWRQAVVRGLSAGRPGRTLGPRRQASAARRPRRPADTWARERDRLRTASTWTPLAESSFRIVSLTTDSASSSRRESARRHSPERRLAGVVRPAVACVYTTPEQRLALAEEVCRRGDAESALRQTALLAVEGDGDGNVNAELCLGLCELVAFGLPRIGLMGSPDAAGQTTDLEARDRQGRTRLCGRAGHGRPGRASLRDNPAPASVNVAGGDARGPTTGLAKQPQSGGRVLYSGQGRPHTAALLGKPATFQPRVDDSRRFVRTLSFGQEEYNRFQHKMFL
ncbi:unnamed protein product [Protopolystoma xenopodis]|uniref:Uncharacterized protein n=1 Tax=Protopolystoma xenopodis TaxID=117903 RepID=A0A3S5B800_9PLAT|nr:unnamed protein product [Protopolystoma xenopodis]